MKNEWYNNEIGKRLHEEYAHDFSVCDIDGVCRCFYKIKGEWHTRLIIYESKYDGEHISDTQLGSLFDLDNAIDWSRFDNYSGTYIIIHNQELTKLKVNKIENISNTLKPDFSLKYVNTINMDIFYNWVSAKDVRDE